MSHSFNLSAFMPKHKQGRGSGSARQIEIEMGGKQTKNKRKQEEESIANDIGIRFIPKRQQQKEAAAEGGSEEGWMISSPRLPLFLIMKGDMARGRGSSQKETALCRNCHAPPPILTCTGPFVVCRTCKLASPGCHIKAGRYVLVGKMRDHL